MKFNFKKIASVITSTVMLCSTVAFAAAANFPAPFVTGGSGDVAVVYGANAPAGIDYATVLNINSKLNGAITTTQGAVISGTDVVSLDRGSSKLNIGGGTTETFGRSITSSDMKTLLADGVFTSNGDNKDHDYTQKIDVANLTYSLFDDNDYATDSPTLGIRLASGSSVLNYTLTFTDQPTFDDTLQNSDITILGKEYLIVDVTNTTTNALVLLDSANSQTFNEGETKTIQIGGSSYDVTVTDVSSTNKVKVSVGGKTSTSLSIGATYKVADGVYIGIKDASYKSKDTAVSTADLSFGQGKLELTDKASVKLNDQTITNDDNDDMIAYVQNSSNKLTKIIMEWKTSNDRFITENSSIIMPGFKSIKLSSTGVTFPANEEVTVANDGKYTIQLTAPITDGEYTLDLLSRNASDAFYTIIGKDAAKQLKTSNTTTIGYDSDTDEDLVVSWANGKDSESYILYATSFTHDSVDKATVKKRVGSFEQTVQTGDTIILGDVQLTVGDVNRTNKNISFTAANTGVTFDTLYTKEGLKIALPFDAAGQGPVAGAINTTTGATSTYQINMTEEDKNGNLGAGANISVTLGLTSTNNYVTVSNVANSKGSVPAEIGSSDLYIAYAYSELGTKTLWDQGPDQKKVTVTYHGGESSAKVYVSDVSSTVIGGGSSGLAVSDNEISSVQNKNLIVVGGSCVNTVAAKLLGSTTPLCGADWQAATGVGAGSFLIQTFTSPYASGKIATLVAGYNAEDTTAAGKYLTTQTLDVSTVGNKITKTTAETQSLV